MGETIFSRILKGELPSHRVYEDEFVIAFLDVNPLSRGHTLVVPREPAETLADLSDEASAALGRILPKLCRAIVRATGCKSYNVLQNNGAAAFQAVSHVCFHIIPKPDKLHGLRLDWRIGELNPQEAAVLALRISEAAGSGVYPAQRA